MGCYVHFGYEGPDSSLFWYQPIDLNRIVPDLHQCMRSRSMLVTLKKKWMVHEQAAF